MRLSAALLLSALVGYVSLSEEILWYRILSYATAGKPQVFAHLLGAFLVGLAFGALWAKRLTSRQLRPIALGGILLAAAVSFYAAVPLSARALELSPALGFAVAYLSVAAVAFLTGGVFPVLCHLAIGPERAVGSSLAWIYCANVAGAMLGPLVTTFVLMDFLSLGELVSLVAAVGLAAAAVAALLADGEWRSRLAVAGLAAAAGLAGWAMHRPASQGLLESLHYKERRALKPLYKHLVETRSGIIAVDEEDIVYGGGAYDGRFNVDPLNDTNAIERALMVAALHRNPERVLEIGLSSASWTRILADHQAVKRLTVVEINPGYLEVVSRYPEQGKVLADPKVEIVIDDGRRWLHRNPEERFDLIVMNTTFHWRNMIANLLSEEFLTLCKRHLAPGGVLYYNTTDSEDARHTAARVFRHTVRVRNEVAASDSPFDMTPDERRASLLRFVREGRPLLSPDQPATAALLDEFALADLRDEGPPYRAREDLWLVTDDNMATEYRLSYRPSRQRRSLMDVLAQLFQ
ncbi:MAG: fused MFS/spermidine synthase [Myxococcales bacterium]|nr:fused MFS/spermidine synthase [Myxococcales bacterium]